MKIILEPHFLDFMYMSPTQQTKMTDSFVSMTTGTSQYPPFLLC